MSATSWISIKDQIPPPNKVVETKIDDEKGCRNLQNLKRQGNLWWFPDMTMYVYYCPTHWRHISSNITISGDAGSSAPRPK